MCISSEPNDLSSVILRDLHSHSISPLENYALTRGELELFLRTLSVSIEINALHVFVDYALWSCSRHRHLGLQDSNIKRLIYDIVCIVKNKHAVNEKGQLVHWLNNAINAIDLNEAAEVPCMDQQAPNNIYAHSYLRLLLSGDKYNAMNVISDAANSNITIEAIYFTIIQPVMREIGRLWHTNKITVAHEHFCTATTLLCMSQFYPKIFSTPKIGRKMVATCVNGELHEMGMRMLTDVFELNGWQTIFLGANVPSDGVISMANSFSTDLLAVSTTLVANVPVTANLIQMVRQDKSCRHIKIIVGGYPFTLRGTLWQEVGADGYGESADDAIKLANSWFAPR